jgi:ketosteroid isomerase-like protein
MQDDLEGFAEFLKRRDAAALAFVDGDAAPLNALVARDTPATFFEPSGACHQGSEEVTARYATNATRFQGGDYDLEILQMGASDDVAYVVGFQRSDVRLRGQAEPTRLDLRVTEIFRREAGEWKLVHRHTDRMNSRSPAR